ncbi:unnamed protein product [Amoebophrya sp. A120]|nr:unnamed protein product [Amoebophrya sp. A120]|eukprot:GSA120T00006327001.1
MECTRTRSRKNGTRRRGPFSSDMIGKILLGVFPAIFWLVAESGFCSPDRATLVAAVQFLSSAAKENLAHTARSVAATPENFDHAAGREAVVEDVVDHGAVESQAGAFSSDDADVVAHQEQPVFFLGQDLGPETLEREYKQFVLRQITTTSSSAPDFPPPASAPKRTSSSCARFVKIGRDKLQMNPVVAASRELHSKRAPAPARSAASPDSSSSTPASVISTSTALSRSPTPSTTLSLSSAASSGASEDEEEDLDTPASSIARTGTGTPASPGFDITSPPPERMNEEGKDHFRDGVTPLRHQSFEKNCRREDFLYHLLLDQNQLKVGSAAFDSAPQIRPHGDEQVVLAPSSHENSSLSATTPLEAFLSPFITTELRQNIQAYVPKYFSTFANARLAKGTLFLGVDDTGEIIGVPDFTGEQLRKDKIEQWVVDAIEKYVVVAEMKSNTTSTASSAPTSDGVEQDSLSSDVTSCTEESDVEISAAEDQQVGDKDEVEQSDVGEAGTADEIAYLELPVREPGQQQHRGRFGRSGKRRRSRSSSTQRRKQKEKLRRNGEEGHQSNKVRSRCTTCAHLNIEEHATMERKCLSGDEARVLFARHVRVHVDRLVVLPASTGNRSSSEDEATATVPSLAAADPHLAATLHRHAEVWTRYHKDLAAFESARAAHQDRVTKIGTVGNFLTYLIATERKRVQHEKLSQLTRENAASEDQPTTGEVVGQEAQAAAESISQEHAGERPPGRADESATEDEANARRVLLRLFRGLPEFEQIRSQSLDYVLKAAGILGDKIEISDVFPETLPVAPPAPALALPLVVDGVTQQDGFTTAELEHRANISDETLPAARSYLASCFSFFPAVTDFFNNRSQRAKKEENVTSIETAAQITSTENDIAGRDLSRVSSLRVMPLTTTSAGVTPAVAPSEKIKISVAVLRRVFKKYYNGFQQEKIELDVKSFSRPRIPPNDLQILVSLLTSLKTLLLTTTSVVYKLIRIEFDFSPASFSRRVLSSSGNKKEGAAPEGDADDQLNRMTGITALDPMKPLLSSRDVWFGYHHDTSSDRDTDHGGFFVARQPVRVKWRRRGVDEHGGPMSVDLLQCV